MPLSPEFAKNPELLAEGMPIKWHLSNEAAKQEDRMTRLGKNLNNVFYNSSFPKVYGVVSEKKEILLGDANLSLLCVQEKLNGFQFLISKKHPFATQNISPVGEDELLFDCSVSLENLNKILDSNFTEEQKKLFLQIVSGRTIRKVVEEIHNVKELPL